MALSEFNHPAITIGSPPLDSGASVSELFLYESRQRRTAAILMLNMGILLAMYLAARQVIEPSEASKQLFYWVNIAFPLVEIGLLLTAIYFWVQNGTFRAAVNADRFEIADPLSKDASFAVPVSEIIEIKQTYQKHTDYSSITMYMKSGEKIRITQNYHFNRAKLYAALAEANPSIRLPENALRFKQV